MGDKLRFVALLGVQCTCMLFMVLLLWLYVSCASVIYIECSGLRVHGYQ